MSHETIIFTVEDEVARLTLNRPEVMNAITPEMLVEAEAAIRKAGDDDTARVIVLTGAGKAFCAGVDLKALGDRKIENGKVGDILDIPARALIDAIRAVPKPVIALVNGFCFTGALEIMLACDLVIASDKAKIGDTHARFSLRPTWGMSARLARRVGYLKAKELSFTADAISGSEAERIGLVNISVAPETLEETLQSMVERIKANSADSIAAYKELYNRNESMNLDESLALEFESEFIIPDTEARVAQFRK